MKVYQSPPTKELGEGGILRVAQAYEKHLPEFGVQFVDNDGEADLIASHAGSYPKPTVLHCHGLYFTADYPNSNRWEWAMNAAVISAIRYSKEVTVPSSWVSEIFQRDMRFTPHVIPHGIEWKKWQHKEKNEGYILWNKNRVGDASDNSSLLPLSFAFPKTTFVSTFPPNTLSLSDKSSWPKNLKLIENGIISHPEMKLMIQRCGVYLSVSKETFCIGALEAMAASKPILGWAQGNILNLCEHGVNGYLAEPGNIDDLIDGLDYCLKHQKVLGNNGQEMVKKWSWLDTCQMVYNVYEKALEVGDRPMTISSELYNDI